MNPGNVRNPTILLADDMADTRMLLARFFEGRGYDVVEAESGREAVEAAVRDSPDLIVMDIYMPNLDGLTAARHIRGNESTRDVPIVIFSAYGELGFDNDLRRQTLAIGRTEYLKKPVDLDQLLEVIERLLKSE
jgi:CheY-like chemotaxis protein